MTLSQHRVPTASVHILLQSYHARNLLFGAYKVFDGPSEPSNQNVNEKKKKIKNIIIIFSEFHQNFQRMIDLNFSSKQ